MILLANHLWQSTLFVLMAAVLALALKNNRAQVRYGIWLVASLKFFVPFGALVAAGSQMPWAFSAREIDAPVRAALDLVSQPFSPPLIGDVLVTQHQTVQPAWRPLTAVLVLVWLAGFLAVQLTWHVRWGRIGAIVRAGRHVEDGRVWEILQRLDAGARIPLVVADTTLEPGVLGIVRPVLLWPRRITERLSDAQIEAILRHELEHVRRRDNLAAAFHMVVQSIYWFHPLVWWLGARLIDERERACDEEVMRQGSEPGVYAESILQTCAFCAGSPLACAAGVTGSDLKKRIEQIMRRDARVALSVWRKVVLATAAAGIVAGPIAAGALNAPIVGAQAPANGTSDRAFEVVSIKPNKSGRGPSGTRFLPSGQYVANNVTLRMLISNGYGAPLQPLLPGQLAGGPEWIDSARFDILGKAEAGLPQGPDSPLPMMIRNMLADRFALVMHREKRPLPIFALVQARPDGRTGPQLIQSAVDCSAPRGRGGAPPVPIQPGERPVCGIRFLRGNISAGGVTMAQFANALSRLAGRLVVDQTGLDRGFDVDLQWTPDPPPAGVVPDPRFPQPPLDPDGPSLFTAIQEQLGLKLVAQEAQVDVLVVDRAELPTTDDFESVVLPAPPPPPPPPPPGL